MSIEEMICVLRRYQDGKQIQWRFKGFGNWEDCTNRDGPDWAFNTRDYRVKPEPREWNMYIDTKTGFMSQSQLAMSSPNGWQLVRVREVLE